MLEICGNIILEIKDLEDLTPVKLANHKNPLEASCGSKDACKDTKCSDKKESVFGQTFSKYQKSTTFQLIGTRIRFNLWYLVNKSGSARLNGDKKTYKKPSVRLTMDAPKILLWNAVFINVSQPFWYFWKLDSSYICSHYSLVSHDGYEKSKSPNSPPLRTT